MKNGAVTGNLRQAPLQGSRFINCAEFDTLGDRKSGREAESGRARLLLPLLLAMPWKIARQQLASQRMWLHCVMRIHASLFRRPGATGRQRVTCFEYVISRYTLSPPLAELHAVINTKSKLLGSW